MNAKLKGLVSIDYAEAKSDLYAAFIQRCLELAGEHGFVGMLTMHTFMFLSSYEKLRSWITGRAVIKTLAHLGPGFFPLVTPEHFRQWPMLLIGNQKAKSASKLRGFISA